MAFAKLNHNLNCSNLICSLIFMQSHETTSRIRENLDQSLSSLPATACPKVRSCSPLASHHVQTPHTTISHIDTNRARVTPTGQDTLYIFKYIYIYIYLSLFQAQVKTRTHPASSHLLSTYIEYCKCSYSASQYTIANHAARQGTPVGKSKMVAFSSNPLSEFWI